MRCTNIIFSLIIFLGFSVGAEAQQLRALDLNVLDNGRVRKHIYDESNDRVYAIGDFSAIDGVQADFAAYYENDTWYPLVDQVNGEIWHLIAIGDTVFVAGNFTEIGGQEVSGIAMYDGVDWHSLNGGISECSQVASMVWYENELYACGTFDFIGGVENVDLLKWNGDDWVHAGLYLEQGDIRRVIKSEGVLYVTGYETFTNGAIVHENSFVYTLEDNVWVQLNENVFAPNIPSPYIKIIGSTLYTRDDDVLYKYDGFDWIPMPHSDVISYFEFNNELYVVKRDNPSTYAAHILKYDRNGLFPDTLSSLDVARGYVFDYTDINGSLWIGGDFETIDNKRFLSQAIFDGNQWSSVGDVTGRDWRSRSIVEYKGEILIFGEIQFVNGAASQSPVIYDGVNVRPFEQALRGEVFHSLSFQDKILARGSRLSTEDQYLDRMALWTGTQWEAFTEPGEDSGEYYVVNDTLYFCPIYYDEEPDYLSFYKYQDSIWLYNEIPLEAGISSFRNIRSMTSYEGKLALAASTLPQTAPILVNSDLTYTYIGDFLLDINDYNAVHIQSIENRLLLSVKGVEDAVEIVEWVNDQWIQSPNKIEVNGVPQFFKMNGAIYVGGYIDGLHKENMNGEWEKINSLFVETILPINNNEYLVEGNFRAVRFDGFERRFSDYLGLISFEDLDLDITTEKTVLCQNEYTSFKTQSDELHLDYQWYFPGGLPDTSTVPIPYVQYVESGVYDVMLVVTSDVGKDTILLQEEILVNEDCDVNSLDRHDAHWLLPTLDVEDIGPLSMTFNEGQVDQHLIESQFSFGSSNVTMSDDQGNLLFYTNGKKINNRNHETLKDSEDFNPNNYDEEYNVVTENYEEPQAILVLPMPGNETQYYIYYLAHEYRHPETLLPFVAADMYYSVIDMSLDNGNGALIEKRTLVIEDVFQFGTLQAVRHGNGSDWWITVASSISDTYHIVLLNSGGTQVSDEVAWQLPNAMFGYTQSVYSPGGTRLALVSEDDPTVHLLGFDNSIGRFTEYTALNNITEQEVDGFEGCSFSPDSRFLYLSSDEGLTQVDLCGEVEEYTGVLIAETQSNKPINYRRHRLGPDNKIYIENRENFTVVNNPNAPDSDSDVGIDALSLLRYASSRYTFPEYPHYNFQEPYQGSCDSISSNIEILTDLSFSVFPNPFKQYLTVKGLDQTTMSTVTLLDITGMAISQVISNKQSTLSWNLKIVPAGTYILQVANEIKVETTQVVKVE